MSLLLSVLLAAVWTVAVPPAANATTQQQEVTAVLHTTRDELWQVIDRAATAATYPLATKLDSRVDTLDARLDTLDARLDSLDARLDRFHSSLHGLTEGQRTQNSELLSVNERIHNQTSQMVENAKHLDDLQLQLQEHGSRLDTQKTQLSTCRSQLDNYTSELGIQQSLLDTHTSQIANTMSRLDTILNRTELQQAQIDGNIAGLQNVSDARYEPVRDCSDLPAGSASGVYLLQPGLTANVPAYCDLDYEGGSWTVFQRRADIQPRQNFYQNWAAYKSGFGKLDSEFWWGLENIWALTSANDRTYELRIDLEDFEDGKRYATYQDFSISSESDGYRLSLTNYVGDAGDAMKYHNGMRFSTKDKDNDEKSTSCATELRGGFWYKYCNHANLNGPYLGGPTTRPAEGVNWYQWRDYWYSLKATTMKMRPT